MAKFRQRKLLAAIPSFLFMVLVFSLQPNGINAGKTLNKQTSLKKISDHLMAIKYANIIWGFWDKLGNSKLSVPERTITLQMDLTDYIFGKFDRKCTDLKVEFTQSENNEAVSLTLAEGSEQLQIKLYRRVKTTPNGNELMAEPSHSEPAATAMPRLVEDSPEASTRSPSLRSSDQTFILENTGDSLPTHKTFDAVPWPLRHTPPVQDNVRFKAEFNRYRLDHKESTNWHVTDPEVHHDSTLNGQVEEMDISSPPPQTNPRDDSDKP
eukprot:GHVS01098085.1.p1 GENE.GHVS01098085.1~~GHVS01098085.1.p1  ORF type:complete len:292 (+),score=20.94 GHVS01098085.1:78-878(+)